MREECRDNKRTWPVDYILRTLVCLLVLLGGCGGGDLEKVPVKGKVTLNGGPWPSNGTLFFVPVEAAEGSVLRPGTARFDSEGRFTAGTVEAGDGLLPGQYRIKVDCWEVEPTMDGPPGVSCVPEKYQNPQTSGLEVTVEPGEPTQLELDVVSEPDS